MAGNVETNFIKYINGSDEKNKDAAAIGLLLIWPFAGALFSFFRLNRRVSLYVIFAFCLVFGWTFDTGDKRFDSYRYALEFNAFTANSQANFDNAIKEFLSGDNKDIYTSTCYYLVDRLGGDVQVLFLVFSVVFAFFTVKSLKIIIDKTNYRTGTICMLLMFILLYSNSIFNVNGVRFWTAAWIAAYAVLKIMVENKKLYFILLLATPMVHAAYWLFIAFTVVSYFVKLKIKILLIAFWISYLLSELLVNNLSYFSYDWMPWFLQHMIYSYTETSSAVERISGELYENTPLYSRILTQMSYFFERVILTILAINCSKFSKDSERLVKFILIYMIMFHVASGIPSVGRFFFLNTIFIVFIWLKERITLRKYNYLLKLIPLVYFYGAFTLFRFVLGTNGITLFLPFPILTSIR